MSLRPCSPARGEPLEGVERLLETGGGIGPREAGPGRVARLRQVAGCLVPDLRDPVVGAQGQRIGGARAHLQRLQPLGDPPVQDESMRGEEACMRHLADPVVRELESVARRMKNAVAHQLLQRVRRLQLGQVGRSLQQREVALAPDDRRHGDEPPARLAQPREPPGDEIVHATG